MMHHGENNDYLPLFMKNYKPGVPPYFIESPEIPSGSAYYFTTGSGLKYEVLFAKKRDNYLRNVINFSVLNEEFDDEYSETNRGEVYRVIATVAEIIRIYHDHHNYSASYEFCGEFKEENDVQVASKRSMMYYNRGLKILHPAWKIQLIGNRVVVTRKTRRHG